MSINNEVGTLKKGLDLFHLVLENPGLTIQEMIQLLNFNQSTTYRLVHTLEQNGFIEKKEHHQYFVAHSFVKNFTNVQTSNTTDISWKSVPFMRALSEKTKETCYIGMLHNHKVVTTQVVEGKYSTRTHSQIGECGDIYVSAIGKCILAYQSLSTQKAMIDSMAFEEKTPYTIKSADALLQELAKIKVLGYAIDNEEDELGVRCIAAPILKNNKVIAAIAISGPSVRFSTSNEAMLVAQVTQCAEEISHTIHS